MPVTYDKQPEPTMVDAIDHVIKKTYPHLIGVVDIRVIPAHGPTDGDGKPTGAAALTDRGKDVLMRRVITSLKWRAADTADVLIYIDSEKWAKRDGLQRLADMDKALASFLLVKDANQNLTTDDLGRPKLENRKFDQVIEIYDDVAVRHGKSSSDVQELKVAISKHGQLLWTGMDVVAANDSSQTLVH